MIAKFFKNGLFMIMFKIDLNERSVRHDGNINESNQRTGKSRSGRSPLSVLHSHPHEVLILPLFADERELGSASDVLPARSRDSTTVFFFWLDFSFDRNPFWLRCTFNPVFVGYLQTIDPMPLFPPVIIIKADVSIEKVTSERSLDEVVLTSEFDGSKVTSLFFTKVSCVGGVKFQIHDGEIKVRSVCLPDSCGGHFRSKNSFFIIKYNYF